MEKKDTRLADRLILPFIVLLLAWIKSKVFISGLLMFKKCIRKCKNVSKSVIPRIGIDNEGNGSPALHYRKKMYTSNIVKALKMPLRGDTGLHQKTQHML